jgi:superfamily I DNA/RNA helicase
MHRVKGLEYRAVFIVGASAGAVPLGRDTQDAEEMKKGELTERSLFYVAASRAKDALFVSCVGEPGEFIKLIQESQATAQKA